MLKRYAIAVVLTLFSVIPSVAENLNDFFVETKKQAEQGDAEAQNILGFIYTSGAFKDEGIPENDKEGLKYYTKAAEQGDAEAQISLGSMYYGGLGIPKNDPEAFKWYTKAAEQGEAYAQFYLGLMHRNGHGVPQNYEQSVKWYTKAAEQGNDGAQFYLGLMYAKGQGVPQNYKEAYIWASLAAAHSSAPEGATKIRDAVAKKLPPKDLIAAQQRAAELQKQIEANSLERENQGKTATHPPKPPISLPYYP